VAEASALNDFRECIFVASSGGSELVK
jgi:hypothetical protein